MELFFVFGFAAVVFKDVISHGFLYEKACTEKHSLFATVQRLVIQQMSGIASGWLLQYVMVHLDGQLDGIQSRNGNKSPGLCVKKFSD